MARPGSDCSEPVSTELQPHQFGSTAYQPTFSGLALFELRSWVGRTFVRARKPTNRYLQVGSGVNVRSGFENLDVYFFQGAKGVVGHDFRFPLPYADGTFAGAYSEHALEHLFPNQAIQLLREICRVLKPGAVFRCSVPDLEKYVRFYEGKTVDPEFAKFGSGCEALWSLTQNWGHLSVWDAAMLTRQLRTAGFSEAVQTDFRQGRNPDLLFDQDARRWESLYVEAVR